MHLSERLKKVVSLVPLEAGIVDVGTDHAAVPITLAKLNPRRKIIGVEYNLRPLQHAVKKVADAGLETVIEIRKGYGLDSVLPGEVEVAVIAGLGSATMIEILRKGNKVARSLSRLILGPMDYPYKLRQYLLLHGYSIITEELIHEYRWYEILVVSPRDVPEALCRPVKNQADLVEQLQQAYNRRLANSGCLDLQTQLELLPILSSDCDPAVNYLRSRRDTINRILDNMPDVPGTKPRRQQLEDKLKVIWRIEEQLCE